MAQTNRQTDRYTDGHGDSMTDPAQRAESVNFLVFLSFTTLSFRALGDCEDHKTLAGEWPAGD